MKKSHPCEFEGCTKNRYHLTFCAEHIKQVHPDYRIPKRIRQCKSLGCTMQYVKEELCKNHWRALHPGEILYCEFSSCQSFSIKQGLCRLRATEENLEGLVEYRNKSSETCQFGNCKQKRCRGTFCCRHWKKSFPELVPLDTCENANCLYKQYDEGLCLQHWEELTKATQPSTSPQSCNYADCIYPCYMEGCCIHHWRIHHWRIDVTERTGETPSANPISAVSGLAIIPCNASECPRQELKDGLCEFHLMLN